jgi:glycosyltransferase involved in cell wall biosynthesis
MLASCDAGVTPLRRDCYADFCLSTKLLECVLLGMPVVAARSRTMVRYFGDGSVLSYEPGNAGQVADAVMNLRKDADTARRHRDAAMAGIQPLRWTEMKKRYARILNGLAKK